MKNDDNKSINYIRYPIEPILGADNVYRCARCNHVVDNHYCSECGGAVYWDQISGHLHRFRAWYSGDIEKKEPLMFEQKEIDHELYFVCKSDPLIKYPFYIPFLDPDWIVERCVNIKDIDGTYIFEGDVVEVRGMKSNNYYICQYHLPDIGFRFISSLGYHFSYNLFHKLKIVGNIHEKKNLWR